jgi:hypothetical protein
LLGVGGGAGEQQGSQQGCHGNGLFHTRRGRKNERRKQCVSGLRLPFRRYKISIAP